MLLWTLVYKFLSEYMFSVWGCVHQGVKLLSHMVILHLTVWGTTKLLSTVAAPFYISTSKVKRVPISIHFHQHLLFSGFLIVWNLVWCLHVVMVCPSLMTNNVECLFMCLLDTCIPFFGEESLNWIVFLFFVELMHFDRTVINSSEDWLCKTKVAKSINETIFIVSWSTWPGLNPSSITQGLHELRQVLTITKSQCHCRIA